MKSTFATLSVASALSLAAAGAAPAQAQPAQLVRRAAPAAVNKPRFERRKRDDPAGVMYLTVANATDATVAESATVAVANATAPVEPEWVSSTALWFEQDGVAEGTCKTVHTNEDLVFGLSTDYINSWTEVSSYCGQKVLLEDLASGKNLTLEVTDASGNGYSTLSKSAFQYFAPLAQGELKVRWHFIEDASAVAGAPLATASNSTAPVVGAANSTVAAAPLKNAAATPVATAAAVKTPAVKATPAAVDNSAASSSAAAAAAASQAAAAKSAAAAEAQKKADAEAAAAQQAQDAKAAAAAAAAKKQADAEAAAAAAEQVKQAQQAQQAQEAKAAAAAAAAAQAKQQQAEAAAAAEAKKQADAAAAAKKKADADAAAAAAAAQAAAEQKKKDDAPPANNGGGQVFRGGFATYYLQNGNPGHCGTVASEDSKVIALPTAMYANGAHCGKQIRLTRTDNGASVVATVRDSCPTCVNNESLDLSVGAFTAIATESEGMVPISWTWA